MSQKKNYGKLVITLVSVKEIFIYMTTLDDLTKA